MPTPFLKKIIPAQFCKVCGSELHGRRDKKYCNLACKNEYQRRMKLQNVNEVAEDVNILFRNRTILKELLDQEGHTQLKVRRQILQKMGFQFQNFTGTYINKHGKTYHYIFDYSWMAFSEKEVLILKRNK